MIEEFANNNGKDDTYFIHFKTSNECDNFKKIFNGCVGHTCCRGRGVRIIDWNGIKVESDEFLNKIKKKYNS